MERLFERIVLRMTHGTTKKSTIIYNYNYTIQALALRDSISTYQYHLAKVMSIGTLRLWRILPRCRTATELQKLGLRPLGL